MTSPLWLPLYQGKIQDALVSFFRDRYAFRGDPSEVAFEEAMLYAVDGAGKRIRPILTMLVYEYITHQPYPDSLMKVLIGMECIHAFTLVHDDLPCMDNDELRRGKPTVWKKYGETLGVLV
jgi:farnesyl diphosphate synthase